MRAFGPGARKETMNDFSKDLEIVRLLRALALTRQVTPQEGTYEAYLPELRSYPVEDLAQACRGIGRAARAAGEKAFPEVGLLIQECERLGKFRRDTSRGCRDCPHCSDGMILIPHPKGGSQAVIPCGFCGGPPWWGEALRKNKDSMKGIMR